MCIVESYRAEHNTQQTKAK